MNRSIVSSPGDLLTTPKDEKIFYYQQGKRFLYF